MDERDLRTKQRKQRRGGRVLGRGTRGGRGGRKKGVGSKEYRGLITTSC